MGKTGFNSSADGYVQEHAIYKLQRKPFILLKLIKGRGVHRAKKRRTRVVIQLTSSPKYYSCITHFLLFNTFSPEIYPWEVGRGGEHLRRAPGLWRWKFLCVSIDAERSQDKLVQKKPLFLRRCNLAICPKHSSLAQDMVSGTVCCLICLRQPCNANAQLPAHSFFFFP